MLTKLSISNFAIIKDLVFEPVPGLNTITGETGAGKSIILDALDLVLGARADIRPQGDSGVKSVIEGEFALNRNQFEDLFNALDIDFEDTTLIRREINAQGKSRSFINDSPVSLQQLKSVSDRLVSVHSQHENSLLAERSFQYGLLDTHAGILPQLQTYKSDYKSFKEQTLKLQTLKGQQDQLLKEKDYLVFLLSEFEQADLKDNEEDLLESELRILSNAEQLNEAGVALEHTLTDSEQSVTDVLNQLRNRFKAIEKVHPSVADIASRLQSSIIELKDISSESAALRGLIQADQGRLERINERLMLIQNLKRKHAAQSYADLFRINETLADQLFAIGNIDSEIESIEASIAKQQSALKKQALDLHAKRVSASGLLKIELEKRMGGLEMPHARVEFELQQTEELNDYGCSDLQVKFTANLGMPLQLLGKVASGGELSRLALCIRSLEARQKHLNTLVFDEIDTGVSGKVADTIGKLFREISVNHQVIAITHLPQVAAYGDAHFMVCKKEDGNRTVSYLKRLNKQERVEEIAKMLSGNESTEIAKKNAMELLRH